MSTSASSLASVSVARRSSAVISTANPNRDGTGVVSALFAAATTRSLVVAVQIKAVVSTTSGTIRLFINGSLFDEIAVPASPISPGYSGWAKLYIPSTQIFLEPSDVITASTERAETFNLHAFGWDY